MGCCINVRTDFGAVADGVTDTTLQLLNAVAGTAPGDELYFPPSPLPYMVQVDALNWSLRTFYGELGNGSGSAIIKALGAGTDLVQLGAAAVRGIVFDAANLAQRALHAQSGGCVVSQCIAQNATAYGVLWDQTANVNATDVLAKDSDVGHKVLGCNASMFYNLSATGNQKQGIQILGTGSGETGLSGQCGIFGGRLSGNGADGASSALLLNGGQAYYVAGLDIAAGQDGIELKNNGHNHTIRACTIGGAAPYSAFVARQQTLLTLLGNSATASAFGRIYCPSPADVAAFTMLGNYQTDAASQVLMPFVLDDGITPWTATPMDFGLVASSPPNLGQWMQGTRVWSAAAGSPIGWICTAAGTPGTWAAFG